MLENQARRCARFSAPLFVAVLGVSLLGPVLMGPTFRGSARAQDEGVWRVFLYGNTVNALAVRGDEVWSATSGGVVRLKKDGTLTQWNRTPQGLFSDSVATVAVDADGRVWCGTERAGISILDPTLDRWRPFNSVLAPIPSDRVQKIRIFGPAEAETVLVGTAEGYLVLVNLETRAVCKKGIDICALPSYDVRDMLSFGGEIWLATATGMCVQKGDGTWANRFEGMGGRTIDLLAKGDSLYAGSSAGLWTWKGSHWRVTHGLQNLPRGFLPRDLLAVGDTLYVAGVGDTLGTRNRGGVYRRVAGVWSRMGDDRPRDCTSLTRTPSGRLYAGAVDQAERNDGIWEWQGSTWVDHRVAGPSGRDHYRSIVFDVRGGLWLSSAQKGDAPLLSRYQGGEWSFFSANTAGRPGSWGFRLLAAGDQVWVAHCCCRDPEDDCRLERVAIAGPSFRTWPITNAYDLAMDGDGFVWLASFHDNDNISHAHGVTRINPVDSTWTQVIHTIEPNLISDQVTSIRADGRRIWIGYDHDGLSRWYLGDDGIPLTADDRWKHFSTSDSAGALISDNVRRIEVGPDGRIWIGTTAGISIYNGSNFYNVGAAFGRLPTAEIYALIPTSDGGAWVATKEGALTRMTRRATGGFNYSFFGPPNLPQPNIEAMTLGPDGQTLWLATARGLASFRPPGEIIAANVGKIGAYPNPLRSSCVAEGKVDGVRLTETGGWVRGVITDLSGKIVARFPAHGGDTTLQDPADPIWNGKFDGAAVAPGLYWIRAQTPHGVKSVGLAVIDADCSP